MITFIIVVKEFSENNFQSKKTSDEELRFPSTFSPKLAGDIRILERNIDVRLLYKALAIIHLSFLAIQGLFICSFLCLPLFCLQFFCQFFFLLCCFDFWLLLLLLLLRTKTIPSWTLFMRCDLYFLIKKVLFMRLQVKTVKYLKFRGKTDYVTNDHSFKSRHYWCKLRTHIRMSGFQAFLLLASCTLCYALGCLSKTLKKK